jgi:hypothetical protein
MKILTIMIALSIVTAAKAQTTGATAGGSASVTTPALPAVNGSSVNAALHTQNGVGQTTTTTSGGFNNTPNSPTANPNGVNNNNNNNGVNNQGFNNQGALFGGSNGFNSGVDFSGTNGIASGNIDPGTVAAMLQNLQANIEQTLAALSSLQARVINNGNGNTFGNANASGATGASGTAGTVGTGNVNGTVVVGNERTMSASGNAGAQIPPASATTRALPPTGTASSRTMASGTTAGTTASANETFTTDPRTLEMLNRLQVHLRQSDALLQSLNGGANVNLNGNVNGNNTGTTTPFVQRFQSR